ncbi:MAG: cytidylate kinase-like family protein [Candidatus Krumholzibacteriia bacterium]
MGNLSVEHLIQRQIHHWNRYRELLGLAEEPELVRPRPIIAISRQLGSGGRELADALARRLDLQIHGYSLIDEIARRHDLERQFVEQLDEGTRSEIELWVRGVLEQRNFTSDQYLASLVRVVRTLAVHGGVLFLGRGTHLILGELCSLRLRVTASAETRVRAVMRYEKLDVAAARERVTASDAERDRFVRRMFKVEPDDPRQYDLIFNTDNLPPRELVGIAMTALEARGTFRE